MFLPLPRASIRVAAATLAPLALVATSSVRAQEVTRVTEVEGITEYRLDNGLRFLLFPDASKPSITVNITYDVGITPRVVRRKRDGSLA